MPYSRRVERFRIAGEARLEGSVEVAGAKNSVLKLMAASLLAEGTTTLRSVPGILDVPIEEILSDRDQENILAKIVLTNAVREVGMRELYRMNITYATLFPDLEGLARSMGYELEFHWAYNPRTLEKFHT